MATYAHALVTDDELADLTGRSRPMAQRRWLESAGVRYFLSQDGRPRTTWGAVEAVLIGNTKASSGVDWSAVR